MYIWLPSKYKYAWVHIWWSPEREMHHDVYNWSQTCFSTRWGHWSYNQLYFAIYLFTMLNCDPSNQLVGCWTEQSAITIIPGYHSVVWDSPYHSFNQPYQAAGDTCGTKWHAGICPILIMCLSRMYFLSSMSKPARITSDLLLSGH